MAEDEEIIMKHTYYTMYFHSFVNWNVRNRNNLKLISVLRHYGLWTCFRVR